MIHYVDTSVILCHLFDEGERLRFWHEGVTPHTSELTRVECLRVIHRRRLLGEVDDEELGQVREVLEEFLAGMAVIALNRSVLRRASEPFPTHVKTLDALHLASAWLWREHAEDVPLVFFTHDRQQAVAARALGFVVRGATKSE